MSELTLLHIADVHLGGSGPAFGARVRQHQQRIADSFARAIDLALVREVAAVCLVGDLFDTPRPSERTVQTALKELRRLEESDPPVPCFIIPGNHDPVGPTSIYRRPEFSAEHRHVWTEPGSVRTPDGVLAVHGNPQRIDRAKHSPMAGLEPDPTAQFNVAMAHGSILIPSITDEEAVLITRDEIAASGMDYVALGHWHDPGDYSSDSVPAHFSGATELVTIGQKQPGGALLVTFTGDGVRVERERTGSLRYESAELAAEAYPDEAALVEAIGKYSDGDLLLDATITGLAPEGFTCDFARLQDELEDSFFRLRILDESVVASESLDQSEVGQQMIVSRAVRRLHARIDQAREEGDADAERLAQRALQLTVALFEGKEVLR